MAPRGCHHDQDLKLNLVSQTSDPFCFSTMLSMRVPLSCVTGLEQSQLCINLSAMLLTILCFQS